VSTTKRFGSGLPLLVLRQQRTKGVRVILGEAQYKCGNCHQGYLIDLQSPSLDGNYVLRVKQLRSHGEVVLF
jgi:hypothetical protein